MVSDGAEGSARALASAFRRELRCRRDARKIAGEVDRLMMELREAGWSFQRISEAVGFEHRSYAEKRIARARKDET